MTARLVIWRSRGGRVAICVLATLLLACVVASKLIPDSTARPSSIPEATARVYATATDNGGFEIDRVVKGDTGPPPPGVIVVQYIGARTPQWAGPFHRREMTYWSSLDIALPDGTTLEPDDPRAPPGLLLAADAAFQRTLPAGTAYFVWRNGVTTWREHRVVVDVAHAAGVAAFWSMVAGFLLALVLAGLIGGAEVRASHRIARGRCWRCAYDRSGLAPTDPCPECGTTPPS